MFMERGSVVGAEIHVENYAKTGAGMWPVESSAISSMGERLRRVAFFSTRCTSKNSLSKTLFVNANCVHQCEVKDQFGSYFVR
jgi:hypothetical protein